MSQLSYAKGLASLTHQLEQGEPVYIYGLRFKRIVYMKINKQLMVDLKVLILIE